MHTIRSLGGLACVLALSLSARADVRLHALFSDNMVLQQGAAVHIWGWADNGEKITIEFNGKKIQTVGKDGKFSAKLPKLKASSQPATLKVTGNNSIELKNVLVGEVWIASGQSNMEWSMKSSFEPKADIEASANPNIRLFTVPKNKQEKPVDGVKGSWQECNAQTVANFSAVAYYFGRDLQKALNVPIGLIHTSWGGSPAEAWMSHETLAANPEYKRDVLDNYDSQLAKFKTDSAAWEKEKAAADKEGKAFTKQKPGAPFWKPAELYNGMIAPLLPYAIKGAIWYQGESNAGRHKQYRTLFPDMITNWRKDWGNDFTFLAVQLAPWDKNKKRTLEQITAAPEESDWAALREAQNYTGDVLKNYGVAVITDVGDKDDIHPAKKQPVGARLALLAEKITYRKNIVASGPTYKAMKVKGNEAILTFNNIGGGLQPQTDLKGFAVAGEDGKYVWAKARVEGKTVIVSAPGVDKPKTVRYGWADYPVVNLANQEGLPASPFRTDAPKD
jgi:sialate O-acetylesterase